MSILDGQRVRALESNSAWASKSQNNTLTGVQTLNNSSDPNSGASISNVQRYVNELADTDGVSSIGDTQRKVYSNTNVVADGDDRKTAIGKLDERFNPSTGHTHNGVDSPLIPNGFFESSHAVTASQSATDLTGETVDSATYSSAVYEFEIIRGTTIFANGRIALQYLNSAWRIADGSYIGEDHGLTWSLTGTTVAQLQVAANAGSNGTIKFKKVFYAV